MNDLLHILYHGTDEKTADKILKEGFSKYTYFAKNMHNALRFGGKYVFEVVFEDNEAPIWFSGEFCWQYRNKEVIPPERIVALHKIEETILLENKKLRKKVFESSLPYSLGTKEK